MLPVAHLRCWTLSPSPTGRNSFFYREGLLGGVYKICWDKIGKKKSTNFYLHFPGFFQFSPEFFRDFLPFLRNYAVYMTKKNSSEKKINFPPINWTKTMKYFRHQILFFRILVRWKVPPPAFFFQGPMMRPSPPPIHSSAPTCEFSSGKLPLRRIKFILLVI